MRLQTHSGSQSWKQGIPSKQNGKRVFKELLSISGLFTFCSAYSSAVSPHGIDKWRQKKCLVTRKANLIKKIPWGRKNITAILSAVNHSLYLSLSGLWGLTSRRYILGHFSPVVCFISNTIVQNPAVGQQ